MADDIPMALEDLHVPCDLVPGFKGKDLEDASFYDVLTPGSGRANNHRV
jgi:GntR family transcriptional regulator